MILARPECSPSYQLTKDSITGCYVISITRSSSFFYQAFDVFKNFYLAKHSGRILTLQPSAGTADLNALFFGKKKGEGEDEGAAGGSEGGKAKKHILCVNTYQMVLLLMFNTRDKVTYEEMREETLIPDRWKYS